MSDLASDIKAWRSLSRHHMPDWEPTLAGLLRLDEGPQELLVALRSIARGWSRDDARWDVLQAVVEFYKRQHAHELAEKIRHRAGELIDAAGPRTTPSDPKYDRAAGFADAASLIDPEESSNG